MEIRKLQSFHTGKKSHKGVTLKQCYQVASTIEELNSDAMYKADEAKLHKQITILQLSNQQVNTEELNFN